MEQKQGRILIADDERLFLDTLCDILKKEGFECHVAADSNRAKELIHKHQYDLLIADIKMPGNENLEFISEVPDLAGNLPVILVTAYPSIETALSAFKLPVVSYLCKPLDFNELIPSVYRAIKQSRIKHIVSETQRDLQKWADELRSLEDTFQHSSKTDSLRQLENYLILAMQNIAGSMLNLKTALEATTENEVKFDICEHFECPRAKLLEEGIKKSIKIMEKTKKQFKSKELAILRDELENILNRESL